MLTTIFILQAYTSLFFWVEMQRHELNEDFDKQLALAMVSVCPILSQIMLYFFCVDENKI